MVRGQLAYYALRDREEGQTTLEYAILVGFLAVAIIIALFFLRNTDQGSVLEGRKQHPGCSELR